MLLTKRVTALYILPSLVLVSCTILVPIIIIINKSLITGNGLYNLSNYIELAHNKIIIHSIITTMIICTYTMFITLFCGYNIAYYISRKTKRVRFILMLFVLLPLWTSLLVKTYAYIIIFGTQNPFNNIITWILGVPSNDTPLLFNRIGVLVGLVQWLIPFMVISILSNLLSQDKNIHQAASILGASRLYIFWHIIVPLSSPAILSGCFIVFILAFGSFITPALLGGNHDMMVGNIISFYLNDIGDSSLAAAVAIFLLFAVLVIGILIAILSKFRKVITT